jgi:probable rRNA maturation factor
MEILISNNQNRHAIDLAQFKSQIAQVFEKLGETQYELSLLLTDDEEIQALNETYRGLDKATDVLSFPQDEDAANETGDTLLGDVVISVETAARQAEEHHLNFNEELILLAIHGILHLLGFDHERSPQDARIMQDKTQVVFETLFPGRRPSGTSNF